VEGEAAAGDGGEQAARHHLLGAVLGQLQVVHAGHHRRQVRVRLQLAVVLAHCRERRVQVLQSCAGWFKLVYYIENWFSYSKTLCFKQYKFCFCFAHCLLLF